MIDKDTYVATFAGIESTLAPASPPWLNKIRKKAMASFDETGFPTPKDEQWRFTRVRPLLQHDFHVSDTPANGIDPDLLAKLAFPDTGSHRLTFINGRFEPKLSSSEQLPDGVFIEDMKTALANDSGLIERHLAQHADISKNPFVALNTAHVLEGAFVHVSKGVQLENPIHLVYVSSSLGGDVVSHPRSLIVADDKSRVCVVESFVGPEGHVYFTNAVSEIIVGKDADVDHYKLQKESLDAYHIATVQSTVGDRGRFNTNSITCGGTFVRNDINSFLDGEDIDCTVDGLYLANGHQHVDNHTTIDHAKPNCFSYELYKGILNGRSKAVFNGRINVHADAQKTDAKQSNRCILLSDDAQVNTNPQLEIYADDVKCTHGAAVGQLDENAVFYLRSRGIMETDARHMLVYAFANEVLEKIGVEPLKQRLECDLLQWLATTYDD